MRIDARLPLRFGTLADARDGDAVLLSHGTPAPPGLLTAWLEGGVDTAAGHPTGCACCIPRNAAALALSLLFLRRGRGEVAAFKTVLAAVGAADADLVQAALQSDPLVSGRFRLIQDG